jgi:uncharacterized membrane protein
LAIAGGGALLVGLIFFAWHALEQGWVGTSHKLMLGGVASVMLTAAAWPLAKRGQPEVAGAVGGAGLGAWFSTWLVARHVHAFVGPGVAFVALVAATIACMVLADRLRLRLMAVLAAVGACATPALTSAGNGELFELMLYQLGVLTAFSVLDVRRNWPELPTLGLLGTWALLIGWGSTHLDASTSMAFMASAGVLVIAGAASTWRLAVQASAAQNHGQAVLRVLMGGVAAWAAAGWAFVDHLPSLAVATTLLAAWHLGFAFAVARRSQALHKVTLGLGWVMACTGGALLGGMPALVGWWVLMAIAMGLVWSGRSGYLALIVPPALCATIYVLAAADEPWAQGAGLVTALMLVMLGLWTSRRGEIHAGVVTFGLVAHAATVLFAGPDTLVGQYVTALVPFILVFARTLIAPAHGFGFASKAYIVALAATGLLFGTSTSIGPEFVAVVGLAGIGAALLARARALHGNSDQYGILGLATAGFVALASMRVLGTVLLTSSPAVVTVPLAAVGLGLVALGLRLEQRLWRHVGLATLTMGAVKVVLWDTAHASLPLRGLSFMAIGALLILGAFAYRRAMARDENAAN